MDSRVALVRKYIAPSVIKSDSIQLHGLVKAPLFKALNSRYKLGSLQIVQDVDWNAKTTPSDSPEPLAATLNSNRSLPMTKFPKQEILEQVKLDTKVGKWRKFMTGWFRIGLYLLKSYKTGIQNTLKVFWDTRNEEQKFSIKNGALANLVREIEMHEINTRLSSSSLPTSSSAKAPLRPLSINRKTLVELIRRDQIWKLPVFFILVFIFEEVSALIFTFFPRVCPYNCLTPGGYKKLSNSYIKGTTGTQGNYGLGPLEFTKQGTIKYEPPYAVPIENLYNFLTSFPQSMISNWKLYIYKKLKLQKLLCNEIEKIYQYLFIDDWLLLQSILNTDVEKTKIALSDRELVNCILERKLYHMGDDLNEMVNDTLGKEILLKRLFLYWTLRYNDTISLNGKHTFSEKWGVNNISLLKYNSELVATKDIQ
ncbi:ADM_collapsed_G0053400.mRNA.1.CDS.1 [Saccharomyces cerevisiae]|nr:ADM_HP2_G0046790.mRNA.1.CDS.1 [Saccharomyces cerevisiae]CAI6736343.1 ADM_HP2_G0046790.mRNA.1.CDS.1 [Saccharomyces cerevisiae]CAI6899414.1 ADM_collapsed_G0053400.mRNA.1.CDS.1 [Saccharomyces cerevisiae]